MVDGEKLHEPEPYVYKDLNEVPQPWRQLRGGRLNVQQVNRIYGERAHARGEWKDPEIEGVEPVFVPDYGGAREEFVADNELVDGLWRPKAKG